MRFHRLLPQLLAAAAFALLAAGTTAAPKWNTLQAPHCLIVSQLSERETRDWAVQFEQFTAALRGTLLVEERFLPPLTVVLFADSRGFAPYCPLTADGKKRDVAGFFASRETWGAIGLADAFSNEATRHVVLHEATHWLISATRTEVPLWLNEGFAEVFSTFQAKKDHGLLGEPIPYHVATLAKETWVPLLQVMLTGQDDRLYTDNNRNRLFYAESWLFVHQLLFKDRAAGYAALNRFFDARLHGADQLGAFQTAFGKDSTAADKDLEQYLHRGGFGLSKLPIPPEAKIDAPFVPATPLAVELALARLALGSQRNDLARTHITQALALDATAPAPQELLAVLEYQLSNYDASASAAGLALERGSADAWMHVITAQELWRRHSDRGTLDTVAREIADHYAKAVEAQPKLRAAYISYARLVQFLPKVTQADAAVLTSGYKIYPDAAELLIGIAVVLQKGRNPADAEKMLDHALSRPDQLSQERRAEAMRLRTDWRIEPLRRQIEDLVHDRRYREALALCETVLQEPMQGGPHRWWEDRRDDLRFSAAMADIRAVDRDARVDEAIRLAEALAAEPWLKQRQRNDVRDLLARLRLHQPQTAETAEPAP